MMYRLVFLRRFQAADQTQEGIEAQHYRFAIVDFGNVTVR